MLIQFTLTMPNNNSWNGKWSGEGNLYAVVKRVGDTAKMATKYGALYGRSFYYNFGDGWGASVRVSIVDAAQARKARKLSRGFCGYEWMIDSIVNDGTIYGPMKPKPLAAENV